MSTIPPEQLCDADVYAWMRQQTKKLCRFASSASCSSSVRLLSSRGKQWADELLRRSFG